MLAASSAARPLSETQSMELSSLARLTHSRHFDTLKHGADGLTVPAGLILALSTSLSARDLHEVRAGQKAKGGSDEWPPPGET